jgi:tetratricopeptide (TPR) repeat protein
MAYNGKGLKCPNCNNQQLTENQTNCQYCGSLVVINSISSIQSFTPLDLNKYANSYRKQLADNPNNDTLNMSLGMCYLKLKLYDKAIPAFEKAIEDNIDNSESFFYFAVSLLKGKKAFLASRSDIDKAQEYINAALMIEPRGIYHYFLAYIRYDYFERKYLNTTPNPNWEETLQTAIQTGLSSADVAQFFEVLQVEIPEYLVF